MAADFSAVLAFSTSPGSPPAIRYLSPPMVRNSVAIPARIPTTHAVVLLITWVIEAAAASAPPGPVTGGGTAASTAVGRAAVRRAAAWRARRPGGAMPRRAERRRQGRAGMSLMGVSPSRERGLRLAGEWPWAGRGAVPPFGGRRVGVSDAAAAGPGPPGGCAGAGFPRTYRNPDSGGVFDAGRSGSSRIVQLPAPDGLGEPGLRSATAVAQRGVADLQLSGDLGERDAFEPVAAHQFRLAAVRMRWRTAAARTK